MAEKLRIYAKASLELWEIQEKIRCGCDGIEYNLTKDFAQKGNDFLTNYGREVIEAKNVEVVHVPYDESGQMMNLERVFQHKNLATIERTFELAQYCADYWKHRIILVIHCSLSMYDFMEYEIFREKLVNDLERLFTQYPQVDLAIENVVLMEYKQDREESPRLCNGLHKDIPQIVNWLRNYFGDRVGTVLDTCHAMMTEKYMKALLREASFYPEGNVPEKLDYSIESYFRANQKICKLIHFNSFVENGYKKNHGTPFTRQEEVDRILDLYEAYGYDCPLTLEIREDDYADCVNYRQTKQLIEHWMRGR